MIWYYIRYGYGNGEFLNSLYLGLILDHLGNGSDFAPKNLTCSIHQLECCYLQFRPCLINQSAMKGVKTK